MATTSIIPDAASARLDMGFKAGRAGSDSREEFSAVLGRVNMEGKSPKEQARAGAEQLVAVALVQPVLKEMRENSHAAPPFAPNQAERTFRGMMDAEFAQRLVKSQRWGLVDAVARRVLKEKNAEGGAEPRSDRKSGKATE